MTELTAGLELDALIAEKVMGWKLETIAISAYGKADVWKNETGKIMFYDREWKPTSDISAAWRVVEKITKIYNHFSLVKSIHTLNLGWWECLLEVEGSEVVVEADTAQMAISLAALKAVEATQKEKL